MGSVIDYVECPHCKNEAYEDFNYKNGETYVICHNCGYTFSHFYVRDEEGKFIPTEDGHYKMETKELKNPSGSVGIFTKKRGGMIYSISSPSELKAIVSFYVPQLRKNQTLTVSRLLRGRIIVTKFGFEDKHLIA